MKKAIIASTFMAATAVLARRYGPTLKRAAMAHCQRMMARHVRHLAAASSETGNGGVVMACKPGNSGSACCSTETKKPAHGSPPVGTVGAAGNRPVPAVV